MTVVIFANAGPNVGLGHLVRCLALARQLQERNVNVDFSMPPSATSTEFFTSYDITPSFCSHDGLQSQVKKSDPEAVVIDSYEVSTRDLIQINEITTTTVIDELGDRHLPVDMVINNNIYADQVAYPEADTVLRGPDYCMLRSEFRELRSGTVTSECEGLNLLFTIGGADLNNSFKSILETTTEAIPDGTRVHAIVGPYFDDTNKIENVVFHQTPSNLPELMSCCDFAVSGGGQTLYELAVCGTPPVAACLGNDQIRNIAGFAAKGFCIDAGWPDDSLFNTRLNDGIKKIAQSECRAQKTQIGQRLVDGKGAIRVAEELCKAFTR